MNQFKAYLFWLFRQPQFPTLAVRIIDTPIGKDNQVNAWGDYDTLRSVYVQDRYGRELSQFTMLHSNSDGAGKSLTKKQAEQLLVGTAIAKSTRDEIIK